MSLTRSSTENDAPLVGPVPAPGLHVMSWNIRRTMTGVRHGSPDFWPSRRPLVGRLLNAEAPTLIGLQEAMAPQADEVAAMLGAEFHRLGRGRRADGGGEGCPVFYDSRRLTLVRWTQYALSPTPHVAGSRGWGNLVPRIAVAAVFRSLETGATFGMLNAHLDHLSRRSRQRSAQMIANLAVPAKHPVLVMGDFNDVPGSPAYRALLDAGLHDTWQVAVDRRGRDVGTYSGYKRPKPDGRRIDWMLARGGVEVAVAAINTTRFEGRAPSDHEPIHAVVSFT